eukprot:g3665.t1
MEVNIIELAEIEWSVEKSTAGSDVSSAYEIWEAKTVEELKSAVLERLENGLSSTGKRTFLKEEDVGSILKNGVLQLQTCLVVFGDLIGTIDAITARNITLDNSKTPVPALFNFSDVFPKHSARKLLQDSTSADVVDIATLDDIVALSVSVLEATDLTELNLTLGGTRSSLVTEAVNSALGAVLSVLGELDALYQASVIQGSELVESVRLSVPDTSKAEKEWMTKIDALFSDQRAYLAYIQNALKDSMQQDLLLDNVQELVNTTQSAANEMMAMIHEQYRDLNHMGDYQVRGAGGRTSETGRSVDTSVFDEYTTNNVWGSYMLTNPMIYDFGPQATSMNMTTMLRGATNHKNYIVGGTVIQTDRRNKEHICYGRFAPLDNYCYAIPVHKKDMSKIPYGRDPVFLVDSSLYDEKSAVRGGIYYDMESQDISPTGIPYGFFNSEVPDKLGTHFVYLDIQFGRTTAVEMLQYLQEGRFMDSVTNTVAVRFVTYNPQFPLTVLGVNEIKCHWETDIRCEHKIDALPDVNWNGKSPAAKQTVGLICGSIVLTAMYWIVLMQSMVKTAFRNKSQRSFYILV